LTMLLCIPIVTTIMALCLLFLTLVMWVKKQGRVFDRIFSTAVAFACLLFIIFLQYWNLLGFYTG